MQNVANARERLILSMNHSKHSAVQNLHKNKLYAQGYAQRNLRPQTPVEEQLRREQAKLQQPKDLFEDSYQKLEDLITQFRSDKQRANAPAAQAIAIREDISPAEQPRERPTSEAAQDEAPYEEEQFENEHESE